ncbi:dihydrodipicolinate synthase family protein [Candidatus Viridilinea mediisalina]|uniref:Dihydrodipicolinate synthase family protein n=1 Tax=Candidatus Viridilinea mediisalina TaxID=2024553 RepID=A0A2A6RHQ2_9CHLR|nr:dihydrodipicolinate synthase family protein [Candidatus Viridilinea mediisalina]PDW02463.1 dihydrodipicolinate synthase family protein [Candidatus Viridilinea mediisalina]
MTNLHGIISAMLTPFTSDVGPVDYEWLPGYLRFLEAGGLHGVLALGTTGEGPSLSLTERQRVLDTILAQRGNLAVIAGTGCAALTETIALSNYAVERGADAILVMPPFYIKGPSEAGIIGYYQALCDTLPPTARLMLYHIPQVTGVAITPTIIDALLASHPQQLFGMKDSSGNWEHAQMLIERYPQLKIFTGSDRLIAQALAHGAAGAITAMASTFPQIARAVYDAHHHGGDVLAAQARLSALRDRFDPLNTPAQLKAALAWHSTLPETHVRLPFVALTNQAAAQLKHEIEAL